MTTPPGDDERFEHIPWEQIAPTGSQKKLIPYAVAGAVLIAGLTATLVRDGGATTPVVPTPTTGTSVTSAPVTSVSVTPATGALGAEAATTPTSTALTTTGPTTTGAGPQVWSEADLLAFPAESLEAEAAAMAEWLASDFFTVDGGTQIADDLQRVFPDGSALPVAASGARSFVEWARAVSVQETAPGLYEVLVVVRRLGATEGEGYRRIAPVGVVITIAWTEQGWSVTDLPALADAPLLVQASGWTPTEVPAEVAAAAAGAGAEILAGSQVGDRWRLVIQLEDSTGVAWPMVIWSDSAGNRIPAPAGPAQP